MPRKKILPASFNVPALLASMGIALGIVLVIAGLAAAVTGRDALRLPEQIERLSPADNEKVLRQSEIMIDFVAGFEAVLIIDGVEIPTTRIDELTENGKQPKPGEQIEIPPTAIYDPGNFTISYLPQDGAPIEEAAKFSAMKPKNKLKESNPQGSFLQRLYN
jgi:uncharacterized protein YjeT (DUF2065 family)